MRWWVIRVKEGLPPSFQIITARTYEHVLVLPFSELWLGCITNNSHVANFDKPRISTMAHFNISNLHRNWASGTAQERELKTKNFYKHDKTLFIACGLFKVFFVKTFESHKRYLTQSGNNSNIQNHSNPCSFWEMSLFWTFHSILEWPIIYLYFRYATYIHILNPSLNVDIPTKRGYFGRKCLFQMCIISGKSGFLTIATETHVKIILIVALDFCVNVHLLTCIWYNV